MTQISKFNAEKTADLLLTKATEKIEVAKKQLSDLACRIYSETIEPSELKTVLSLDKRWLHTTSYLRFKSPLTYYDIDIRQQIPKKSSGEHILISNEDMDMLKECKKTVGFLIEQRSNLRNQLVSQLMKLRTYAKIEKDFPEAFVYLPQPKPSNLPAIDIKDVMFKINNF